MQTVIPPLLIVCPNPEPNQSCRAPAVLLLQTVAALHQLLPSCATALLRMHSQLSWQSAALIRVQAQQLQQHPVGPAEANLRLILPPATRCPWRSCVVFLVHVSRSLKRQPVVTHPGPRQLLREFLALRYATVPQALYQDMLQRGPGVGCIPLLPGLIARRQHACMAQDSRGICQLRC